MIVKLDQTRTRKLQRRETLMGWLYISPILIGVALFTVVPLVMSIMSMFRDWNGIDPFNQSVSVGFLNFQHIFGGKDSEAYWKAFGNTFLFAIQLPIGMILGVFLALGMNRKMRGAQTFRVIYYLPCVMSVVAVSIVWQKLFVKDGSINSLLMDMHLIKEPIRWFSTKAGITFVVNLLLVWKGVGYTTLMFLAGLQSVSTDQIEAAKIDGADSWIIFLKITLPALYPIIFYLFVTGLMGALQMFNEPYILLGGYGGNNKGMTTVGFVFDKNGERGVSAVGAWFLAIVIFIITAIQMAVDKKTQEALG